MTDARFHAFLVEQAPRHAPDELLGRSMAALDGVEQQHPWLGRWSVLRFAVPTAAAAVVLVLAATALLLLSRPTPVVGPSPSAGETAGETAGPTGSPTTTPSPSPTEEPTPVPTPLPSVEGLLSGPATCTNDGAGYSVSVPAGWYVSVQGGGIGGPCSIFSTRAFDGETTDLLEVGGITTLIMAGDPVGREFTATEHQELTLDGMPAIREVGENFAGPGVRYAVSLDGSPVAVEGRGPVLSARAFGGSGVSLEEATRALDEIMAGFRLLRADAVDATVLARIEIPLVWDAEAAGDRVAVTPEGLWVAGEAQGGGRLVRIDPATNRIAETFSMNVVALAVGGDGALWVLSDPEPGARVALLSRFDAAGSQPQPVGEVGDADDLAVGLDSVWLMGSLSGIRQLDLASASVLRLIPTRGRSIDVACEAIWTWWPDPAIEDGEYLSLIDLSSGQPVSTYKLRPPVDRHLVDIGDHCWTAAGDFLLGVTSDLPDGGGPPDGSIDPHVWVEGRLQFAGKAAWAVTDDGVARRVDLQTGFGLGDTYRLSFDDIPRAGDGSPAYRLLSAAGNLWVIAGTQLVRYDIPSD